MLLNFTGFPSELLSPHGDALFALLDAPGQAYPSREKIALYQCGYDARFLTCQKCKSSVMIKRPSTNDHQDPPYIRTLLSPNVGFHMPHSPRIRCGYRRRSIRFRNPRFFFSLLFFNIRRNPVVGLENSTRTWELNVIKRNASRNSQSQADTVSISSNLGFSMWSEQYRNQAATTPVELQRALPSS